MKISVEHDRVMATSPPSIVNLLDKNISYK